MLSAKPKNLSSDPHVNEVYNKNMYCMLLSIVAQEARPDIYDL